MIRWHKQHRRAILFCSVFFAGAFLYGYDGVYMASLLGKSSLDWLLSGMNMVVRVHD